MHTNAAWDAIANNASAGNCTEKANAATPKGDSCHFLTGVDKTMVWNDVDRDPVKSWSRPICGVVVLMSSRSVVMIFPRIEDCTFIGLGIRDDSDVRASYWRKLNNFTALRLIRCRRMLGTCCNALYFVHEVDFLKSQRDSIPITITIVIQELFTDLNVPDSHEP